MMDLPLNALPAPENGMVTLSAVHQCSNTLCEKYDVSQVRSTTMNVRGGGMGSVPKTSITCKCGGELIVVDILTECLAFPVEENRMN